MDQQEAGFAIEPFNMKEERREGHFDDDFNYASLHRSMGIVCVRVGACMGMCVHRAA